MADWVAEALSSRPRAVIHYCHSSPRTIARLRNRAPAADFRQLPCYPSALPAQYLLDAANRSFRVDANEAVLGILRRVKDRVRQETLSICDRLQLRPAADIFEKYLQYRLGVRITDTVFLAFYLKALALRAPHVSHVLLVPEFWWAADLREELGWMGLSMPADLGTDSIARFLLSVRGRIGVARQRTGLASVPTSDRGSEGQPDLLAATPPHGVDHGSDWVGPRASGIAFDGFDSRLRNNFGWAWGAKLPKEALAVLWNVPGRLLTDWERWFAAQPGAILQDISRSPAAAGVLKPWRRRGRLASIVALAAAIVRVALVLGPGIPAQKRLWLIIEFVRLIHGSGDWLAFFRECDVCVHVEYDYGTSTYYRALAMRIRGGIVVLDQRSQYYDNYDYTSDRPGDIAMISGAHGLRYFSPRLFDVPQIAVTGLGSDGGVTPVELSSARRDGLRLIALFDEPGVMYGVEHVHAFLDAVFRHCGEHRGYRILYKPKRDKLVRALPSLTRSRLADLESAGLCEVMSSHISITSVCGAADAVLSVPSTAACIAVALGKRVFLYNPYRIVRTMFYEHGLQDRYAFETPESLFDVFGRYLEFDESDSMKALPLRKALDPWLDFRGDERKGSLIKALLESFRDGLDGDGALDRACERYVQHWGPGTAGDWTSAWEAVGGPALGLMDRPPPPSLSR